MRYRDRSIEVILGLLIAVLIIGETTSIDFLVQDQFFERATGRWMVDPTGTVGRLLFYDGPKAVIIALGAALIALLAGPRMWRERLGLERKRIAAVLLVLGLVPAFVGFLKDRSNVYCPAQLARYGGERTYQRPFLHDATNDSAPRRGRCWPAGHASGGFGLIGLTLLARTAARRRAGLAVGLGVGWTMGLYQMFKGAHFLSHTAVTMMIALLFVAVVARALQVPSLTIEPKASDGRQTPA